MVTQKDYSANMVKAARSVLIELVHLLGEYREHLVVIGGWTPELLFPDRDNPHVGSLDVDLALNHRTMPEEGYETIEHLLAGRGYERINTFSFRKIVVVDDKNFAVDVDFLAGEYQGTGRGRRHQRVQDIQARKARGCDLAFDRPLERLVEGELPGGGHDQVTVRVAATAPFLVMKGMALADRLKEKDAWDIYYCLTHYLGGLDALAEEFQSYLPNGLVQEGLRKIAAKFQSVDHVGPKLVADFEELTDPEARAMKQRDAYERVAYLLRRLELR